MIDERLRATTDSGDGAAIVWSGRAWTWGPVVPAAPCPDEAAKRRAFVAIFDAARRAKSRSERACVLLENYSHLTASWLKWLS